MSKKKAEATDVKLTKDQLLDKLVKTGFIEESLKDDFSGLNNDTLSLVIDKVSEKQAKSDVQSESSKEAIKEATNEKTVEIRVLKQKQSKLKAELLSLTEKVAVLLKDF